MIPDFQTLMLPVLRASSDGEVRISDVVSRLADDLGLSSEERSHLLHSGKQTTFANRVAWAKSYLAKAGLVELTKRAYFQISQRGNDVLAQGPARIDIKYLGQFPEFQAFREAANSADEASVATENAEVDSSVVKDSDTLTPDETMRKAHSQLESSLASDLLQRLRSGTPAFFEKAVVQLLIGMGYGGGSVIDLEKALVGGAGDGGIDGVIDQDLLGLDRIYVQAKRYADGNSVGPGAIRDFFGSLDMRKASKGVFVTASTFSAQASDTVKQLGKRIVLIDGIQLARLMIRHHVGCRVEETLAIMELDEEFFE
jgi:restriction system protein